MDGSHCKCMTVLGWCTDSVTFHLVDLLHVCQVFWHAGPLELYSWPIREKLCLDLVAQEVLQVFHILVSTTSFPTPVTSVPSRTSIPWLASGCSKLRRTSSSMVGGAKNAGEMKGSCWCGSSAHWAWGDSSGLFSTVTLSPSLKLLQWPTHIRDYWPHPVWRQPNKRCFASAIITIFLLPLQCHFFSLASLQKHMLCVWWFSSWARDTISAVYIYVEMNVVKEYFTNTYIQLPIQ